jgi:hypothetical protein
VVVEIFKIEISVFWCILKWPARWGGRLGGVAGSVVEYVSIYKALKVKNKKYLVRIY